MANYTTLKAAISNIIKTNGNNEITGQLLQDVLLSIINNVGKGATYLGNATPETSPGVQDGNVFYVASQKGEYTNFGGIIIEDDGLYIIKNNPSNGWDIDKVFSLGSLGIAFSIVKNPAANFSEGELKTLKAIKDIKLYGFDLEQDYFIQVFTSSGGSNPDRVWIANANNLEERYTVILDHTKNVTKTSRTFSDGTKRIDVLVDWTGTSGTILNGFFRENTIISKRCYSEFVEYVLESEFEPYKLLLDGLNNYVNEVFDTVFDFTTERKIVNTVEGYNSVAYGGSIAAWAAPVGVRKKIYGLQLVRKANAENVRVVIKRNDYNGTRIFNKKLPITDLYVDFGEVVENAEGSKLWVEIYFDALVAINRVSPAQVYTEAKGYPFPRFNVDTTQIDSETPVMNGGASIAYYDIRFDIDCVVETIKVKESALPPISGGGSFADTQFKKNLRISCVGSSVTWGTGYLQDSMLNYLIPNLQKGKTECITLDKISVTTMGEQSVLQSANDRLFFDKKAFLVTGTNSTIDFEITGDEISIVQGIERSNARASIIDLYINDVLYDSFDNFNMEPLGREIKTFTAVAGQKEFLLERPFTYNHILKVNGVAQTVTLNKGMAMPPSGWAVARDIMDVDGVVKVQHTLFSPTALSAGDVVECEFDFGQEIRYEKTTIGKDGAGVLESTYGRGYTPFDPANPGNAAFGSGLDFRETDERVVKKYVFETFEKRKVTLKIRGLSPKATGTGSPYFIFNFATNRMLYFQNAGIGGWKSTQFNDASNSTANILRTWREVVDFQPDIIFYESTPNDDWSVGGYKLSTPYTGLTLAQLQDIRTLPNKSIQFVSASNTYNYEKWLGTIEAMDKNSVTISSDTPIASNPAPGDSVVVGSYYSDNKQYVARLVRSYDAATRTITFDRPINERDFVWSDYSAFVGQEIQVRDLTAYKTPTIQLLEKLKGYGNNPKIGLVPNPAPNMKSRDLAAYQPLLDDIARNTDYADYYVGLWNVYDWQYSQKRDISRTIPASSLIENPDGTKSVDITDLTKANNYMRYQVMVNGIDVTNTDAVVYTSYCLGVDRTLTGAALNDTTTRGKQVWGNFFPKLIFLRNAPTSGDIVINLTTNRWSNDSCHMNANSQQLFAIGYEKFVEEN